MTANLSTLRANAESAYQLFLATVDSVVTGASKYDWYRALPDSVAAGNRRNDDTGRDADLAGSVAIKAAHDEYIRELHIFYGARDGERGVLGGRGL